MEVVNDMEGVVIGLMGVDNHLKGLVQDLKE